MSINMAADRCQGHACAELIRRACHCDHGWLGDICCGVHRRHAPAVLMTTLPNLSKRSTLAAYPAVCHIVARGSYSCRLKRTFTL